MGREWKKIDWRRDRGGERVRREKTVEKVWKVKFSIHGVFGAVYKR